MIIPCPSCKKKFEVEASLIPNEGKMLQCGFCSEKWFFKKEPKKKVIKEVKKIIDKTTEKIHKNVPDSTEKIINEAEKAITKKNSKINNTNSVNILSFLVVFIISAIAIIILADTFKNSIKIFIPGFDIVLSNLYESFNDVFLFFKDLLN